MDGEIEAMQTYLQMFFFVRPFDNSYHFEATASLSIFLRFTIFFFSNSKTIILNCFILFLTYCRVLCYLKRNRNLFKIFFFYINHNVKKTTTLCTTIFVNTGYKLNIFIKRITRVIQNKFKEIQIGKINQNSNFIFFGELMPM